MFKSCRLVAFELAQFEAKSDLAPRSGCFDPTKSGVFVTSATFVVHCWDQRSKEVNNRLTSSTEKRVIKKKTAVHSDATFAPVNVDAGQPHCDAILLGRAADPNMF
ncbi:hypothetical protein Y032_0137g1998 [Ancylostoma ceylanicum]|uniref:Uncharacterized protein n=1 Tax=Ancylostoma ceylanicum TaxID=53326 RepID=A0A016T4T3_9BILA|nr:hypothetical protein Y032_0137g1998 [Ancylostoma ceylanicum]